MRIRELTLKNYRVFADPAPFAFAERFTVIAGINGRGKTAILDALAILASRLLPLISPARSGYRSMSPSEVHLGATGAALSMKTICAGFPIDYDVKYDMETRRMKAKSLPAQLRREVQKAYGDPIRADDAAPLVVYYTTDRAGYRLPKKIPSDLPRGQAVAYVGALANRTVNFRDFMGRYRATVQATSEERRENPNYFGERAINTVSQALQVFLGNFRNLRVEDNPIRLMIDKNGSGLDLTQLSDGERAFLALVCDLCRRLLLANPHVDHPLRGAGVVLIDELELHLHPTWQLEVAEKLRATFPGIQFIATTHSPFILQTAREGEVIKLDGELAVEPAGRTLEEVSRLVMDVTNTERSPRYQSMLDTARRYLALVEESKNAQEGRRAEIQRELVAMLAPFSDNPAYRALLERKGLVEQEP
jgi:predicted ATP-binding protein involved in virulence